MKSIVISNNESGQRIDKFLTKYLKRLPTSLIYKYIRKKRIKINNKKCEISYKLSEGDVLDLYINDEFFIENSDKLDFLHAPDKLNILYEDSNILIIDKKPGLIVHPDKNIEIDCLINRIKKYLFVKNEYLVNDEKTFSPSLVNRLDRNTGGIVLSAKNAESLRILNDKIRNREIKKYYLCKVTGIMPKQTQTLSAYLRKNSLSNLVDISFSKKSGYKNIVTKYTVISQNNNESLLEIDLITGRTHQIRAHLSAIGHPIIGDGKYGNNLTNIHKKNKYQCLYSYMLKFNFLKKTGKLDYLNGKVFKVSDIWFLKSPND